jgi:hypothetical protein
MGAGGCAVIAPACRWGAPEVLRPFGLLSSMGEVLARVLGAGIPMVTGAPVENSEATWFGSISHRPESALP